MLPILERQFVRQLNNSFPNAPLPCINLCHFRLSFRTVCAVNHFALSHSPQTFTFSPQPQNPHQIHPHYPPLKESLLHCRNFSPRNDITARKLLSAQWVSHCLFIGCTTYSSSLKQCGISPFSQLALLLWLILPSYDTFSATEHDPPRISTSPFSA